MTAAGCSDSAMQKNSSLRSRKLGAERPRHACGWPLGPPTRLLGKGAAPPLHPPAEQPQAKKIIFPRGISGASRSSGKENESYGTGRQA